MVLIVDCYDSFVHNLERYLNILGAQTRCIRCDKLNAKMIQALSPSHIVLSPGPCTPDEAGYCIELVQKFSSSVPILGVCLGHQVIGQAFGARIQQTQPVHGKACLIHHHQRHIFQGIPNPLKVARYHSLAVNPAMPPELVVDAKNEEGITMAISHRDYPVYGVQFHPESILTDSGLALLENFLKQS